MHLGCYQTGDVLPLRLQCVTAAAAPMNPYPNPVAAVYGPTGALVQRVTMAGDLRGLVTGNFRYPLQLGAAYATPGLYAVLFTWGSTLLARYGAAATFLLRAGGHSDGAVRALFPYRRPEALYLVRVTEAGVVARGRNPR